MCLLLISSSCVTTQDDVQYLNDRIVALSDQVNKIQQSMQEKLSGDLDSNVASVRTSQAELGAEMDRLREEVQRLSGRVEENGHLVRRAVEKDTTEQDTVKASVTDLGQRTAELEGTVKQIQQYLALESASKPKKPVASKPPLEVKEPTSQPSSAPQEQKSPETELYESSLAQYREGKYEKALAGFESFLKKYPQNELADNAQFWTGECYMAMGKYEQAILAYQEVIKNYPKGNKVPNAMLRQALAFYEINDKISSSLLLKKIIKNYPDSTEAKIAEAKLKTIK